jgi:enamine deaminase RidA (YjgF/YER057c/UK114 family)
LSALSKHLTGRTYRPEDIPRRVKRSVIWLGVETTNSIFEPKAIKMIERHQKGSRMSQAVCHGGLCYISGQVADNRDGGISEQNRTVLSRIEALLQEAGTDKPKVLSVNVFLPAIGDFDSMNQVYDAWIDPENPPARACIEAHLADPDLRIEIAVVAAV